MKLKKILRLIGNLVYWFVLGHLISLCILGKNTTIVNIALGVCGAILIIYIIKCIFDRMADVKTFKNLKVLFYYLSESHKYRYHCLLKGDVEGAKEFEELIELSSKPILQVGPNIATYKTITKKEREEVKEIINKTKALLTTTQSPV